MAVPYTELTARQMAARLKRRMRGGKSMLAVCEELEWSYSLVYQRLDAAGLVAEVMAAKYQTTEAAA